MECLQKRSGMFFNKQLWVSKWDKVDSHAKIVFETIVHHEKQQKLSETNIILGG